MQILPQTANDLWLLVRVACSGGADIAKAARTLKQFTLIELSSRKSRPNRGENIGLESLPFPRQAETMEHLAFFMVISLMLERNPIPAEDHGLLRRWERIGIGKE
jgi:hypothetical protein